MVAGRLGGRPPLVDRWILNAFSVVEPVGGQVRLSRSTADQPVQGTSLRVTLETTRLVPTGLLPLNPTFADAPGARVGSQAGALAWMWPLRAGEKRALWVVSMTTPGGRSNSTHQSGAGSDPVFVTLSTAVKPNPKSVPVCWNWHPTAACTGVEPASAASVAALKDVQKDGFGSVERFPPVVALWRDLEFDATHGDQLGRVAVVGDKKWEKWAVEASAPLFPCEMRFFESDRRDEADAWACATSAGGEA